jgi:uncharacterized coiled-coil protein SlyX
MPKDNPLSERILSLQTQLAARDKAITQMDELLDELWEITTHLYQITQTTKQSFPQTQELIDSSYNQEHLAMIAFLSRPSGRYETTQTGLEPKTPKREQHIIRLMLTIQEKETISEEMARVISKQDETIARYQRLIEKLKQSFPATRAFLAQQEKPS